MMRCEPVPASQREEWETALRETESNPLHRPEVLRLDHGEADLVFLRLLVDGDLAGCALAARAGGRLSRLLQRSALYLPTVPALREGGADPHSSVMEALLVYCRKAGYRELTVDGRWGWDFSGREPFVSGIVNRSLEFELGLDRPAEEILAGMDRYHRKNVRRAGRAGVSVTFETSLDALLLLRDLQVSSSTRGGEKGNPFGVRDSEYFHRAFERVYAPGWGEVAFARVGEETVAGLAYLTAGDRSITVRSGATSLGYETNAMYVLQHEVLIRLGKKGVREINLGAVPQGATEPQHPQHGLYAFKKGFGGTPRPRTRVTLPVPRRPRGEKHGG